MSIKVYKVFSFCYSYGKRVASWVIVQRHENLSAGVAIGLEKKKIMKQSQYGKGDDAI